MRQKNGPLAPSSPRGTTPCSPQWELTSTKACKARLEEVLCTRLRLLESAGSLQLHREQRFMAVNLGPRLHLNFVRNAGRYVYVLNVRDPILRVN